MPKPQQLPDHLRPYRFHGVDFSYSDGDERVTADCPWCGREGKFTIQVKEGLWRCFVCSEGTDRGGGNAYTFLRLLWKMSDERTNGETTVLAADRRLAFPETLSHWGACVSVLTGDWLVPGYGPDGKLNQLYRMVRDLRTGKWTLLPTPGLGHAVHGVGLFDRSKPDVYVCEGPWDGMALWEVLRSAKVTDGGLGFTASPDANLLAGANVVAVPGCTTFPESWRPLFSGKRVALMYDSDHPRENGGKVVPPAGLTGMRRVAGVLAGAEEPPAEVRYLRWGPDGYDPDRKSGWDVRDHLAGTNGVLVPMSERVRALQDLLTRIEPVPTDWVPGRSTGSAPGRVEMDPLPCSDWRTLVNAWRKALRWTDGLEQALAVMLASIVSTKGEGDQVWVKVIGPAACGKSTLCEAVSVARKYVLAKSTIRGFHSGFGAREDEDNSLLALVSDKTLVTKDGDTLLQSPNLPQILSEARDVYDRVSRTHYRNKMSKDYANVNMTWLLCGTSSLRSIDSSELGQRFLDCVIMDRIDDDLEDEILERVAHKAVRNRGTESGSGDGRGDPDLTQAMRLTGGYVEHLRENARELLSAALTSDEMVRRCTRLGKFVAYFRARPSKVQDETADRECANRLVGQLTRLATCLAAVLNKTEVDDDVIGRVRRVALDTARGVTLDVVRSVARSGRDGVTSAVASVEATQTPDQTRKLLRFLKRIGAVETYELILPKHTRGEIRWRLTPRIAKLYVEVVGE